VDLSNAQNNLGNNWLFYLNLPSPRHIGPSVILCTLRKPPKSALLGLKIIEPFLLGYRVFFLHSK
jgi:hypothetical protein